MKLKVCGLKHQSNINELNSLSIDYMGFIFYKKSPRNIDNELDFDFMRSIPKHIKKVGVFVNESNYSILNTVTHYDLDLVQLHGEESPETCKELKSNVKIIKAFQITETFDFSVLENYLDHVDYFLFDTPTAKYGGSGHSFNWQILEKYNYNTPFFLSGGINGEHIEEIKKIKIPQLIAIDINSKFEIEPGLKNIGQINQFILKLNNHDKQYI